MLRQLGCGLLAVGLVVGVIDVSEEPAWATSDQATSVKVGPTAFLAGMYAEAAIRGNGSFGSSFSPAGFHASDGPSNSLGFVAIRDAAQPSWAAADAAGLVDGDFFVPGVPVEVWALKVGSVLGYNNHELSNADPTLGNPNEIAGSLGSVTDATGTSGNNTVSWSSSAPFQGLNIVKTYSLPQAGQRVDVTVTLTNSTGAPIADIYYGRGLDPDDGQLTVPDVYRSTNTIVSQISAGGSSSRVSAEFTRGSQISLYSTDPRSAVSRYFAGFESSFNPVAVWAGTAPQFIGTVGSSATGDAGILLAIKIDSLGAGQSTTFTFSYLLTESAGDEGGGGSGGGSGGSVTQEASPSTLAATGPASAEFSPIGTIAGLLVASGFGAIVAAGYLKRRRTRNLRSTLQV